MQNLQLVILTISLTLLSCNNDNVSTKDQEAENLKKMRTEIFLLSASKQCEDPADWDFTAIGSNACGGPTGFIAFSLKLNTTAFLEKVKKYTNSQKEFNIKWEIISTCDLPPFPSSIRCVDGKAQLIY